MTKKEKLIRVNSLSIKPKKNRKLAVIWAESDNTCTVIFKRMLEEGEKPETNTCHTVSRLGMKTTAIALSDEAIPDLIGILMRYMNTKDEEFQIDLNEED